MVWIVVCLVLVTNDVREPGCNELFLRVDLCCFDENNHFLTEIEAGSTEKFLVIRFSVFENDAADVISHENQLQHLSEPSIFMLDVFRTADHADRFPYHTGACASEILGVRHTSYVYVITGTHYFHHSNFYFKQHRFHPENTYLLRISCIDHPASISVKGGLFSSRQDTLRNN